VSEAARDGNSLVSNLQHAREMQFVDGGRAIAARRGGSTVKNELCGSVPGSVIMRNVLAKTR
jgi:hypothetical protein